MSPNEVLYVVGIVISIGVGVYTAIKIHTLPAKIADDAIQSVLKDPELVTVLIARVKTLPPETQQLFKDAGLLLETVTK